MSAFEIASALLRLLTNPLIAKGLSSIWGYKKQIKHLEITVKSIQAVLLDAEEKQLEDPRIRVWLESLREPFYDAEDLLDEISYVLRRREQFVSDYNKFTKEALIFFSHYNQLKFAVKVPWKIKQITEKLDVVAKNRRDLGLTERQPMPACRREETPSFVHEEDVIGRDMDREAIIGMLFEPSYDSSVLSVISIVGIGGMGKTTLAQFVFNDERVKDHFQLKLWVSVSDGEFSEKRVVSLILDKISPSSANDKKTLDQLQGELREKIKRKKYLLILDDVWNEDHLRWVNVKRYLLGGSGGSWIIVTTRSRRVSDAMEASNVHELLGLSDEDAWSLFIKMSFGCSLEKVQERHLYDGRVKIGKDIVKKCANVPLAIRVVGSALHEKEKSKWLSFKNTELAMISDEEEGQNRIMQILRVSYNHLSPSLKRCFSFCALFPKDCEIEIERLTRIWIANDCVATSPSHIEDVCKEYFSILVQRCFFQSFLINYSFKVHDLMHDLAKEVSKEEFVSVDSSNFLDHQFDNKTRHLGIYFESEGSDITVYEKKFFLIDYTFEMRKLRTFTTIIKLGSYGPLDPSKVSLSKFLRVLDVESVSMKNLPKSIGSLSYLRYLNLSGNYIIEKLPESITKLWSLEYLLVRNCLELKELPKDLKRLVNLKQLSMKGCNSLSCMPHGMGSLTSLYMLDQFFVCQHENHGQLEDLGQLRNLRGGLTIKVRNEAMVNNIPSRGHDGEVVTCLTRMKNLSELRIVFSGNYDVDEETLEADDNCMAVFEILQPPTNVEKLELEGYEGKNVPSWFLNPIDYFLNLVDLRIIHFSRFRCLPPISRLQFLKILYVYSLHSIEYMEENISQDELSQSVILFPCLERMELKDMPKLKGWWRKELNGVDTEHEASNNLLCFPHLSYLLIERCPKLTQFPKILSSKVEFNTDNLREVAIPWKLSSTGLYSLRVKCDETPSYSTAEVEDAIKRIPDSLKYLYFYQCDGLRVLPRCLKHLKSLRQITITECVNFTGREEEVEELTDEKRMMPRKCVNSTSREEEVEELTDEERMMPWKGLKSLERLEFTSLPELVILPLGIQSDTSLQSIYIHSCSALNEIPEWMPKLSDLKSLEIWNPNETLKERCNEETGEDWPKIHHIPRVSITITNKNNNHIPRVSITIKNKNNN